MNRNNFWIHLGIAVVVITFAAVLGQISRWQYSRYEALKEKRTNREKPTAGDETFEPRLRAGSSGQVSLKRQPAGN
jgi:hypothetical protein